MQSEPFFEALEDRLAPFTDEQVDLMMDATESDLRYRVEIWALYAMAVVVPTSVLLLGMYLMHAYRIQGPARIISLVATIALMFGATRLFNMATAKYARWRYQSSFLRQLTSSEASGL